MPHPERERSKSEGLRPRGQNVRVTHEMAWSSSGRMREPNEDVALCHLFSVDDVLKFSKLSIMPNFMTLIESEGFYHICRLKVLSIRREKGQSQSVRTE